MVRNYEPVAVAPEVLVRMLDAARRAPSAGFSQGQTFVVVTEAPLRRAIAALAGEDEHAARGFDRWLSAAPVHVIVCVDEEAYSRRYAAPDKAASDPAAWPVPYPLLDCGASLMLLLLAAVDEGLAAGFIGAHRLGGLKDLLDIPEAVVPVGLVTVGHPAPDRRSGSLAAGWKPLSQVVHWERWGARGPSGKGPH